MVAAVLVSYTVSFHHVSAFDAQRAVLSVIVTLTVRFIAEDVKFRVRKG